LLLLDVHLSGSLVGDSFVVRVLFFALLFPSCSISSPKLPLLVCFVLCASFVLFFVSSVVIACICSPSILMNGSTSVFFLKKKRE
jgi:hypothetical protein